MKNDPKKLDYIEDCKSEMAPQQNRSLELLLYVIGLLFLVSLIWAYFAKIDIFAVAQGRVEPSSDTQVIQNLEGGIIKQVLVQEGERIVPGQILAYLDDTRFASEYKTNLAKQAILEADIARLTAEVQVLKEVQFSADLIKNHPREVAAARQLFKNNISALEEQLKVLRQNYAYAEQELKIIGPLADSGVMSRLDKIELQKNLGEVKQRILEKKEQYRSRARESLDKAAADLAVLNQSIAAAQDRMQRTVIRAPVAGIINKINVSTVGEVIEPGMKIIEIVPTNDKLTIAAYLKPSDVGFVKPGNRALVKVSAYDYTQYGGVEAILKSISADTTTDKNGNSFYEIKLTTTNNYVGKDPNKKLVLRPGMVVTVHIITGEQTVLRYLLKPFFKTTTQAFRER